jgi:hypothetical protein
MPSLSRVSAALTFVAFATCGWSASFNPATAFEAGFTSAMNPNGVWSYGYSSGFTNSVTLFTNTVQGGFDSSNEQLWLTQSINVGDSPAIEYNNGPAFNDGNVAAAANQILLVAGIQGQYADLIFTAPAAGTYTLTGSFTGDQVDVGDFAGIVSNGSVVFNSTVTSEGQIVTFNNNVTLAPGNTVVFSVGPDSGLQNVGLNLTVSTEASAPEPSALVLLCIGLIALIVVGKLTAPRARQGNC